MLSYSRQEDARVELIGVFSPYLSHGQESSREEAARFLGVDVIAVGEWSLLKALDEVGKTQDVPLNAFGLLDDDSRVEWVASRYRELASRNEVEPIADPHPDLPVEPVWVYALDD